MSRTARYKLLHILVIVVVLGAFAAAYWRFQPSFIVVVLFAAILIVPSRIHGIFWREFFRGRRLLGAGDARAAAIHFERFRRQLRQRPGLGRLIGFSGSIYTRDADAMTLNNLGAARLQLSQIHAARSALEEAVRLDPEYPMPVFNLALLAQMEGRVDDAAALLTKARALGYSGARSDRLASAATTLLAHIEGIGNSAPPPGCCIYCGYILTGNQSGRCPECGCEITHDAPRCSP